MNYKIVQKTATLLEDVPCRHFKKSITLHEKNS